MEAGLPVSQLAEVIPERCAVSNVKRRLSGAPGGISAEFRVNSLHDLSTFRDISESLHRRIKSSKFPNPDETPLSPFPDTLLGVGKTMARYWYTHTVVPRGGFKTFSRQ